MLTYFLKTAKDKKLHKLDAFRTGSWVLLEEPSEEELTRAEEVLPVDPDTLRDGLDPHEVPRIKKEKHVTYVFARVPHQENGHIFTYPILFAVGDNFLLTLTQRKHSFLDKFRHNRKHFYTTQKAKLFFQLFYEIHLLYEDMLTSIRKDIRQYSVDLNRISNRDITRFVRFENSLNDFLSALQPINTVLDTLLRGKFFVLYEQDKDLIEDLSLANEQLVELCRLNLKSIVNIRDAYSTVMTHSLNRVIKILTALTIVLTIPTIIASLYGMNVELPLGDNPYAFWYVLGTTLVLGLGVFTLFVKKDWL